MISFWEGWLEAIYVLLEYNFVLTRYLRVFCNIF